MVTKQPSAFHKMGTRISGSLAVGSGALCLTALGSISNSCDYPNMVYYYSDIVILSGSSAMNLGFLSAISFWLEQPNIPDNFNSEEIRKIPFRRHILHAALILAFLYFLASSTAMMFALDKRMVLLPLVTIEESVPVEKFCKSSDSPPAQNAPKSPPEARPYVPEPWRVYRSPEPSNAIQRI